MHLTTEQVYEVKTNRIIVNTQLYNMTQNTADMTQNTKTAESCVHEIFYTIDHIMAIKQASENLKRIKGSKVDFSNSVK